MFVKSVDHRRRPAVLGGLSAATVCGLFAAGAAVACAAAAEPADNGRRPAAVLDLASDGFLVGGLVPSVGDPGPRATLLWRAPLFAEPVEFEIDGIERIRFARVEAPKPPATAWRVGLRDGCFAIGEIEAIDAEHVVLEVPGVADGRLRVRRGAIERLSRQAADGSVIVPGGLEGWDFIRGAWQERGGRLVGNKPDSHVFRDVAAPPRACFDLTLSWDAQPDMVAFFAGDSVRPTKSPKDNNPAADLNAADLNAAGEQYRLEMTGVDLVAVRDNAKLVKLDPVASIAPGAGTLRLLVFVDQQAGRMAVVLPGSEREATGKPVFDETLEPTKPGHRTGFGIVLRAGTMRIDGLRVVPWTDAEPRLSSKGTLAGPDAAVESFNRATGMFVVRGAEGPREVAAADLSAIEFPAGDAAEVRWPAGSVMAAFHGGTRIAGRITEITEKAIRLDCPSIADPLVCKFVQLAEFESLAGAAPRALPGSVGRLESDDGDMLGCLANTAEAGGVGWLPLGAVKPVPLDAETPRRITYRGIAANAGQKLPQQAPKPADPPRPVGSAPAGQATIYLKTGDSFQCAVVSADTAGLRIRTDLAGEQVVPAVTLRAVELAQGQGRTIPPEKLARLLTLPRMMQADPPTNLLRLTNGDYLRGKLVSLDEKLVRLDVVGVVKSLPRTDVTRIIWLSVEGDKTEAEAVAVVMALRVEGSVPVRATMNDGNYLSLAAERVDGDRLVGRSGAFGVVGVELARCGHLDLGLAATEGRPANLPFQQWKFKPAVLPLALQGAPGPVSPPGVDPPRGDLPPAKPAVIPVLPLLEPGDGGRRQFSAVGLEGRIAVLGLVELSDRAGLDRLPRLAEIAKRAEADGVVCSAIVAGGSRDEVARAVSSLAPRPPIAVDAAGRVRAAWGGPHLPVCLLVDREGRVAGTLPLVDDAIEKIEARVAELVAASKETGREFQALARANERALAGDRGCLDDLSGLLEAKSEGVRRRSIGMLRQLTGMWDKDLPFRADDPPDQRSGQVRAWRHWLARVGLSAKLAFPRPVEAEWTDSRPITGRTLVCRPEKRQVVELDESGREVLTLPGVGWACDVTPQGTRLIGDHAAQVVVEYDTDGREVWAVRGLPGGPMSARRLDNGNTLMALSDADLVAEFDRDGKMAWSVKVEGRPSDAHRLPDGSTLVAAHRAGRIVEFDATGEQIWSVEKIEDPQAIQRLPNGNTLVAMGGPGIVREIDREGNTVWQKEGFRVPLGVQRLPNGRTLVQEQEGDLVEVAADGSEIARIPTGGSRFLRF